MSCTVRHGVSLALDLVHTGDRPAAMAVLASLAAVLPPEHRAARLRLHFAVQRLARRDTEGALEHLDALARDHREPPRLQLVEGGGRPDRRRQRAPRLRLVGGAP